MNQIGQEKLNFLATGITFMLYTTEKKPMVYTRGHNRERIYVWEAT